MKKTMDYTRRIAAALAALAILGTIGTASAAADEYAENAADINAETVQTELMGENAAEVQEEELIPEETVQAQEGNTAEEAPENALVYTITFDTDGGNDIAQIQAAAGTPIEAPAAPVKEGFVFGGWDKEIPAVMPEEDITLKAVWEDSFMVFCKDAVTAAAAEEEASQVNTADNAPAKVAKGFEIYKLSTSEVLDKIIELDNAAIDDLADMLPCGNTLTQPLKWLTGWLGGQTDEEVVDPVKELSDNIDSQFAQTNTRIDQLDSKIDGIYTELNNTTAKITAQMDSVQKSSETRDEWIRIMNENSNRLTRCTADLNELNTKATGISGMYYQITGIESDDSINEYQKLIELAALSHDPTMKALTEKLDILADNMYCRTGSLNTNFFEAVALSEYGNVMFTREAWENSRESADIIVEQYLTASMLYLRTLEAEKAIASFGEDELYKTDADYVELWTQLRKQSRTINSRYERVKADIEKVITGYKNYVSKINTVDNRFIDHCRRNNKLRITTGYFSVYGDIDHDNNPLSAAEVEKIYAEAYSGNVLTIEDMNRLTEYVREHPCTRSDGTQYTISVMDFLERNGADSTISRYEYFNYDIIIGTHVHTEEGKHGNNYSFKCVNSKDYNLEVKDHYVWADDYFKMGEVALMIELC